ncbi:MFS transporter [Mycolicibacterium sp. S2-37]|uniref:MFS transporter n=1 Tax=Mycolicibacterium sp. S2-37 TaxID=2810297 RepID=UPI001A945350|nr:MFS transporter [Mycolicibacterium sp. S2-37]MBO0679115.1 MFS transporter [Mycolicibacterium sp. S2-37]
MTAARTGRHPLRATWVLMIGFFLVVVDSTIVPVANPVIRQDFDTDHNSVVWVTSAYLLAFATCLLIGGRLGDRFGPRNVYLVGLAVFTASSVWCGLSMSIDTLIAARIVQGIGAALLAPQTFSIITRMFPAERRGVAMSLWGATAGAGMLIGPLAGGALVDGLGRQWIFLINIPIGVAGLALAVRLIPDIPGRRHRLDLFGALLSGAGIGLIVFGLQEGQHHDWAPWSWGAMAGGLALIAAFVFWQAVTPHEPLIPLPLFGHRNFVLANAGIALVSFAFVAFITPLMFYLQEARGLSPTSAALLTAPLALATAALAPLVGRIIDRVHPRPVVAVGFTMLATGLLWLALETTPTASVWRLTLPLALIGVAGAFTWEPLAVIASRTLPPDLAGAGSAVYNTARQVGAVLSSAGIAALMTRLLSSETATLPADSVAQAMSQSLFLPAVAAILGAMTALFFTAPPHSGYRTTSEHRPPRNVSVAP